MVDVFRDDYTGAKRHTVELARQFLAAAGGLIIGAEAQSTARNKADQIKREDQRRRYQIVTLQVLLQDPAYQEVYERVSQKLQSLQERLEIQYSTHSN